MIAGGPRYRIWFTNLIYRNTLYTATYKWPNIRLNNRCDKVGAFSRQDLNKGLKTARFVGAEILQGKKTGVSIIGGLALSRAPPGRVRRSGSRLPWLTSTSTRRTRASGGRYCSSACRTYTIRNSMSGSP